MSGEAFSYANWLTGEPNNNTGYFNGLNEDRIHFFSTGGEVGSTWNDFAAIYPLKGYLVQFDTAPLASPIATSSPSL